MNRQQEQQQPEEEREMFVVQKCRFDCPLVEPSVDCLRLFEDCSNAERAAHESACLFAATLQENNRCCSNSAVFVRTILLPSTQGVSYAFVVEGKLFWVRSVSATVVPVDHCTDAPFTAAFFPPLTTAPTGWFAHGVLTDGVLGGSGNAKNNCRGIEGNRNRVFVSRHASASRAAAEHAAQSLATAGATTSASTVVVQLPIGSPISSDAKGGVLVSSHQVRALQFLHDWPDRNRWAAQDGETVSDWSGHVGVKRRELQQKQHEEQPLWNSGTIVTGRSPTHPVTSDIMVDLDTAPPPFKKRLVFAKPAPPAPVSPPPAPVTEDEVFPRSRPSIQVMSGDTPGSVDLFRSYML